MKKFVEGLTAMRDEAVRSETYRCAEIARTEQERAANAGEDDLGEDPFLSGCSDDFLRGYRAASKRIEDAICTSKESRR